jgi:hypothetical protein
MENIYCKQCGNPTPHLYIWYFCFDCAKEFNTKTELEQEIILENI